VFLVLLAILVALAFGYTAATLAAAKGHRFWPFFLLGFALPLIGTIVVAAMPAADRSAAPEQ